MPKLTKGQKIGVGAGIAALITVIVVTITRAAPPPEGYCCPYCGVCFDTLAELQEHVRVAHPGERIPIIIDWE